MTPEQAPKFIPPNEVYVEFTDPYCVGIGDAHYCWDDKELVKDHPTTRYIRADRVELMVNELQREIDGLMYQLGEERRKNTELHKECADLRFKLQHWTDHEAQE